MTSARCGIRLVVFAMGVHCWNARAAADTWIVDQSGLGDYTEIQPAIEGAGEGDLVLVNPGTYAGFAIIDKAVSVLAQVNGTVLINGSMFVHDLAVGKFVKIAGVETGLARFGYPAMQLSDSFGSIRVQACVLRGREQGSFFRGCGTDAVLAENCADAAFMDCVLIGGDSGHLQHSCQDGWFGGRGLDLSASTMALYGCQLTGGKGGDGVYTGDCFLCGYADGGRGGDAARLWGNSFLFAAGSTIQGGEGGVGDPGCAGGTLCDTCGGGGSGIRFVESDASAAKLLDDQVLGGSGGVCDCPGEAIHGSGAEVLPGQGNGSP